MHGEYKVPGGKFVRADFEVVSGKLVGVVVNGDFFLDPPEALEAISAALEGAPSEAGREEFARLVRGSLPPDAEMIGFAPEDVATAIERGLGS